MKVTKFDQLVKHLTEMSFTPWDVPDNDENFEAFALRDFVCDERRDENVKNSWLSLLGITDVDSADEWYEARENLKRQQWRNEAAETVENTGQAAFDYNGFEEHLRMAYDKPDEYPLQNI